MDVAAVRWLTSPQGWTTLRELPPYDPAAELAIQTRLRTQGVFPEHVAAALLQSRLRARARAKFGDFADGMLFTADGLEQATRLEVSAAHASRYAAASLATVHDLGCGIGSDAMAMSALGVTVHGVDIDPVTARVADANLQAWPDSRARVGRAEDFERPRDPGRDRVGVWFDPARRLPGVSDRSGRTQRTFRLDQLQPSWAFIRSVAAEVPATGAKLSPSFPHTDIPDGVEAQWVSFDGDVVECALWWGPLARRAGRSALVLSSSGRRAEVTEAMATEPVDAVTGLGTLGPWLYEPDRALTQAGLLGAVTAQVGGAELDSGVGYVASDRITDLPFARRYAVRDAFPFTPRTLKAWLRRHDVTGLTIKKRGIRLDDDGLRRQLGISRTAGSGAQAIVLLTRVAGEPSAIILDPA